MNEPDISPLAKRLAEENNVRWQELKGSGAGGKVVERDVLEYLARVMAGEEAVDPTPEPVPEGMESWPEEDLAAYRRELSGDLGDLQAELSAADRIQLPPSQDATAFEESDIDLVSADDGEALDDAELISEDIFLFEESEAGRDEVAVVDDDDLLIAGDDGLDAVVDGDLDLTLDSGGDAAAEMFAETAESDEGGVEAHSDDAPAETDPATAVPGLFAADDSDSLDDDVELFSAAESAAAGDPAAGDSEVLHGASADELDLEMTDAPVAFESGGPSEAEGSAGEGDALTFELDGGDAIAPDEATEAVAADGTGLEVPDGILDLDTDTAEPADEEAVFAAHEEPVPTGAGEEAVAAEANTDTFATSDSEAVQDLAADPQDQGDEVLPLVAAEGFADLPLVSYGTLLRRHIDLTALAAAQLAVGREVDQGDPIPPTSFVVRAAAKAQEKIPLGAGSIGVASFDSGFALYGIEDAAGIPYTELLRQMMGAAAVDAGVDGMAIVVADMSALDVDEAVLHLGVPVLTLGRILYDNQQGSYRSTLSLAGDVGPDRGARFLARVAELLDAPVQLVL